MAKLKGLIREVLYEEKEKNLKVFYTTDIFIQGFVKDDDEEEEVTQSPVTPEPEQPEVVGQETPEQPAESTEETEEVLNEDIFKTKSEGVITVPQDKAKSILTLDDLLEYVENEKNEEQTTIINDLVVEIIKTLTGSSTQKEVGEILKKGDKCNVTLDYGFDKEDSIGLQVNKNAGVDLATIIMRKDGNPLTGEFNLQVFNQTITGVFLKEIQ